MSESFEDLVSNLDDIKYSTVEAPVALNASVSAGFLIPHNEDCTCDLSLLVISFVLEDEEEEEPLRLMVLPQSPLGVAILSGEFGERCKERLGEIS